MRGDLSSQMPGKGRWRALSTGPGEGIYLQLLSLVNCTGMSLSLAKDSYVKAKQSSGIRESMRR